MVIVAAAFCPHPPLLVPALASGAAVELDELRSACDQVVHYLVSTAPDALVVLGSGPTTLEHRPDSWGSLAGFGLDLRAGSADDRSHPTLPLSLTIGAWLLDRADHSGPRRYLELAAPLSHRAASAAGKGLATADLRTALLVMGDGSARRSVKGPGYFDLRAEPFDAKVAAMLAGGEGRALAGLDQELAGELLVAGAAPWSVAGHALPNGLDDARLLFDQAPYGVGYLVALWSGSA